MHEQQQAEQQKLRHRDRRDPGRGAPVQSALGKIQAGGHVRCRNLHDGRRVHHVHRRRALKGKGGQKR